MAELSGGEVYRPVLLGQAGPPTPIPPPRGGNSAPRIRFTSPVSRDQRIGGQFARAMQAFTEALVLTDSVQAADPQLVIVFEALDEHADLQQIARNLGLEILVEAESAIDPDDEVVLVRPERARDPQIASCVHAICMTANAMERILVAWRSWQRDGSVPYGLSPLKEFFSHLRDVRAWGPIDRTRGIDWEEYFGARVEGEPHLVEIELWYRDSRDARRAAVRNVNALIEGGGGTVLNSHDEPAIGYLAIKAEVPEILLRTLAAGRLDEVALVRSADVLFFRVQGQALLQQAEDIDGGTPSEGDPGGSPRVLILDGVPVANHERLAGRIRVDDPDDLESEAETSLRRHGTAMASVVVWGDIGSGEPPLERPVLVRPVLVPSSSTVDKLEQIPSDVFIPDLMRRVFAEQFPEGVDDGLTVVNISIGDPSLPFDSMVSSWARTLDWLSYEYGVLIVVSAGNRPTVRLPTGVGSRELLALTGAERSAAIHDAQFREWAERRIIAPAESVNAITVGAIHEDADNSPPRGYLFDPHDGQLGVSPVSRLGGGHRRAVKPEVVAPGGRAMFNEPFVNSSTVQASTSVLHGIRVASPTQGKETTVVGTSPATALITRRLSRLVDLAEEIAGPGLSRHERSVAAKALLLHGARHPEGFSTGDLPIRHAVGYGAIQRNLADGCESNEATVLFIGELGALERQELLFPLPNGLSTRDVKRVTATLAWLSPVNWRHRQYRKANLSFAKPTGLASLPASLDVSDEDAKRGSSTVKHQTWEFSSAVAGGAGDSFTLTVKCNQQAGGLGRERVTFAAVVSLWVDPAVDVDVYTQVSQQVRSAVAITPSS